MRRATVIFLLAVAAAAQAYSSGDVQLRPVKQAATPFSGIVDAHIVNGKEAQPHQFPWQVAIHVTAHTGRAFCGGSLIARDWVLTAGHCVQHASEFEIYLGAHSIREDESTQQRFVAKEYFAYGGWSKLSNDVALIKLPSPATLNEYVQLVRLPAESQKKETFVGHEAVMSGWGHPSDSVHATASILRFVKTEVVSDLYCSAYYFSPSMWLRGNIVCVSGSGGKATCDGDSGGPLVVFEEDGAPTLIGVTSYGIAFGCESGWPSVFARITKYLDWIRSKSGVSRS